MHQFVSESASEVGQLLIKQSVIIDTDIGDDIDDAFALALALNSPEIDLQAVTTVFGDTYRRARLAAHLLQAFGREDIPVAAGIGVPLLHRHRPSGAPQAAVVDGQEKLSALSNISGPDLIIKKALAQHGQLTLLCIGPLTNIAIALMREPALFMAIRRVIMIGGSSTFPFAEWNVRSDAKAAQIVLGAGIPITMLGWDITTRCKLREHDIVQLCSDHSPQAQLLSKLLGVWQRHRPRGQSKLPYMHDPLTIAALCKPDLLRFEHMTVHIITHGLFKGTMVPRVIEGPLVLAAVDIQAEQAHEWITQRILNVPAPS